MADYDGDTVSVIDVSTDIFGNDSQTFGTTFTIPAGHNPASVTVLSDGSRAYTADQADGTVHVLNLSSHSVEKTLAIVGHPRTVVSTSNSLYGKVYVASPDSPYVTIIRTDQDIVDTTVLVEGNVIDVRVSTQDATRGTITTPVAFPEADNPATCPGRRLGDIRCMSDSAMTLARFATSTIQSRCRAIPPREWPFGFGPDFTVIELICDSRHRPLPFVRRA